MNPYNPYQAPQMMDPAGGVGGGGAMDGAQITIMAALKRTRPWVMFLSILGFLGAGLMILLGLIVMVTGSAMSAFARGAMSGFTPVIGLVYIALGALYFVPAVLLWRYAASISDYSVSGGSMDSLASAMERQASFWRFVGILTAVMMVLYFLAIFIAIIVGAASAMR